MAKFINTVLIVLSSLIIIGCGGGSSTTTVVETPTESTLQAVAIIQDGYDGDNTTLIRAANNMHEVRVNVIGIVTNSYDIDGRFGDMFQYLLTKDIPIYTDRTTYTRQVPSGRRYPELPSVAHDDNRPHLDAFAQRLEQSSGNVILVSGGHLTAYWYLAENYPDIMRDKVSKIVIANGFDNLRAPRGSMNFTQGLTSPNPSGDASIMTFSLLPDNIEIVLPIGTNSDPRNLFDSARLNPPELHYLHVRSPYYHVNAGKMHVGDIDSFNYVLFPEEYDSRKALVSINHYGFPQEGSGREVTVITRNKPPEHIVQRLVDLINYVQP